MLHGVFNDASYDNLYSGRAISFHNVMATFSYKEFFCLLQILCFLTGADPKAIIRIRAYPWSVLLKSAKPNVSSYKFLAHGPDLLN